MTSRSRIPTICAAAVLSLALAGCGGDDTSSSTSTTKKPATTTTTAAPTTSGVPAGPSTTGPTPTVATTPVGGTSLPPVGTGKAADLGGGVKVMVTKAAAVDVTARVPGETSGPAVAVTVQVDNTSGQPFDLAQLAVNATYGDNLPAVAMESAPADPLTGTLADGATRRGVYVFRVPKGTATGDVMVTVESGVSPNALSFDL